MSNRRKGREAALQLLYQVELRGERSEEGFEAAWRSLDLGPDSSKGFAEALARRALHDLERIDDCIARAADNWQLERLSRVDLSILRVAVCELLEFDDVPVSVVVNEAVEIAKRFSGGEAASFINGVLDRVARDSGRLAVEGR